MEAGNEDMAHRNLHPRDRQLEGPAVLPHRAQGWPSRLGRGLRPTKGKEKVVAECIQAMAPHVIGSAYNIRHTGQVMMYGDFAIKRGSWKEL